MKKLTDEWKIKKATSKNKSFRDSIDFEFSDGTKNDQKGKNNASSLFKKEVLACKSPFSKLDVSTAATSGDSVSLSLRRSCRLRDKSVSVKVMNNRIKDFQNTSFSFNDSFGLKMANNATTFERDLSDKSQKLDSKQLPLFHSSNSDDSQKSKSKSKNSNQMNINKTKVASIAEKATVPSIIPGTELEAKIQSDESEQRNISADVLRNENKHMKEKNMIQELPSKVKPEIPVSSQQSIESLCTDVSKSNFVPEEDCYDLSYWGLPSQVISAYRTRNISKMFQWQYECLSMKDVLNGKNLVYSAPTSAGKTLVAEILMLKKVLETKKKAMMILPFVSVVREKVNYLQEIFQDAGVVVDGYMGTHRPPGGFKAVNIAICTIEKANNLVNRLMEEKHLDELGILVVDELHMLGDNSRGYLLELLLTKLLYNCNKYDIDIQIIGMSATLPNLNVLSFWLHAELYHTDFRPVPLHEMYKVGPVIYDSKSSNVLREMGRDGITFANDPDHTIYLTLETVTCGNGVLIFCPSKNWCETLATNIAHEIYKVGRPQNDHKNPKYNILGQKLRKFINGALLSDILLQLKSSPAGLDSVLKLSVPFGVAFHHAGLTFDERDIIEGAFRQGILKVLVATTTLSSGVNLPARRVLIRSPLFCGAVIDTLSYKQMVGRAGRKGIDDEGESILLCKESERKSALQLVNSELKPVTSCLLRSGKNGLHTSLKRAVIEVIASGAATTHEEVIRYASCTLLCASLAHENSNEELSDNNVEMSIKKCLDYLLDNDFIFKIEQKENDSAQISYKPSQLGTAILASGFSPEDSLRILKELQLARRCFVLENDLHILYEVIPPYLSDQMGSLNWMNFLSIWEQLPEDFRRVAELVGVRESFIGLGVQGRISMNAAQSYQRLAVHQRFYAALALNDLIHEIPLAVVSEKYNCNRGILQSLQQTTSTFSGMLTIFCNRLGWHNLELLFSHFQKRVHFGIQQELCDLVQLSTLNAQRARVLYNAGFETVTSLASADPGELELILCNAGAFESEKQLDGEIAEEVLQRREVKRIRITGKQGVNEREAAVLIIKEAQNFIKHELGIKTISWQSSEKSTSSSQLAKSSVKDKVGIELNDSVNTKDPDVVNLKIDGNISKSRLNLPCVERNQTRKNEVDIDLNNYDKNNSGNTDELNERNYKLNSVKVLKDGKISNQVDSRLNISNNECNKVNKNFQMKDSKSNHFNIDSNKNILNSKHEKELKFTTECLNDKFNLCSEDKNLTASCGYLPKISNVVNLNNDEICVNSHVSNTTMLSQTKKSEISFNNECLLEMHKEKQNHEVERDKSSKKILQDSINKSAYEINQSYFHLDDVDNLFDELEQTVRKIEKEISHASSLQNNENPLDNNLTFSQILLSQSAEAEDVYFAESFAKVDFQNFSSLDLLDNNPNIKKTLAPSNSSKLKNFEGMFTSKKTIDVLDAIFDSPCDVAVSDNGTEITTDLQNIVPCKNYSSQSSNHLHDNPKIVDTEIEHNFTTDDINSESIFSSKSSNFNIALVGHKMASQSTPKLDVDEANFIDNDFVDDVYSPVLLENCNFDFTDFSINDANLKSDNIKRNSNCSVLNEKVTVETSGDLFESEDSFEGDPPNKIELNVCESEKCADLDKNVHSLSSCSDEIFTTDKSFDKILENPCIVKNNSRSLQCKENCDEGTLVHEEENKMCEEQKNRKYMDNEKVNLNYRNSKPESENSQLSPNIVKQLALENSRDIFEDNTESEPVLHDARKHFSFEFQDHSDIFKSWNPSPTTIQPESPRDKNENIICKENFQPDEAKLGDMCNDSFAVNRSAFSSFSSDCLEPTPPEKTHSNLKTIPLQTPVTINPNQQENKIQSKVDHKIKCKLFDDSKRIQVKENDATFHLHDRVFESTSPDVMNLNIVDVSDEDFSSFLKLLANAPMFSLSVACQKVEQKNAVSIGPPNLRAKKGSIPVTKLSIDDDILIAGLSFYCNKKTFFINFLAELNNGANCPQFIGIEKKLKSLQQLFNAFTNKKIVVYDIKSHCKVLWRGCCIALPQNKGISYLDPSIAAWLLNPSEGQQTVQELVLNYWTDAAGLIEGFDRGLGSLGLQHWSSVSGQKRASTEAYVSFHLTEILLNHLKDKKLSASFTAVEMPSVLILAQMEQSGLGFDLKLATDFRKELQNKLDAFLKKAHQLAGRKFNIMSTRDLSRILYKELKLNPPDANCSPMASRHLALGFTHSSSKKLPPQLKTNRECLEKIMHLHPLPKTIIDWRKLSFAVTKVLMPLLRENKFDSQFEMYRLYSTCYIYTVTGRINMHSPNLQFIPRDFNIDESSAGNSNEDEYYPIDDEISQCGVSLRNMFVPAEGNVLLSADYSQLELRILAHLSGDVKLLKSLNGGDDIFKQIAATWKSMAIESVSDELRQQAKKICYGIIYGMSSKTLSQQLKTTENEAACFMGTFKRSYPGVTNYLNSIIKNCQSKGYVTTIMERRRYLPSILSHSKAERAQAERQAINTTIQGSAADIIKMAMIEIEKQLEDMKLYSAVYNTGTRNMKNSCCRVGFLVLQLHDELIYEVSKNELKIVQNIIKTGMERTTKLSVVLPVNIRVGSSWGFMKEVL